VFKKDGQVTAGNASTLNDGASAVLLADADFAKRTRLGNSWLHRRLLHQSVLNLLES
jgi:acetyl-CoA acetyltransferase